VECVMRHVTESMCDCVMCDVTVAMRDA